MVPSVFVALGNLVFITAPSLGFLPQLVKRKITFAPILSTILILANTFKLLYFNITDFSPEIFLQSLFLIVFHFVLLAMSRPDSLSILEEKVFINRYTEKSFRRYGLFSLIFSLIITAVAGFYAIGYFVSNLVFYLACPLFTVLECSVGIVQLLILETESRFSLNKQKAFPRELFLLWALGDLLKLAWMIKIKTEAVMCFSVVFQIVVDLAVVSRNTAASGYLSSLQKG